METEIVNGVRGASQFLTTRWSMVFSCTRETDGDTSVEEALADLCHTYWRPVFTFVCCRGYSSDDAQDLTQDFFLALLRGKLLHVANPERGRFRCLLQESLRNFLIDSRQKRSRIKRGGAAKLVSWDDWMSEAPSHLSLPQSARDSWTAERLFDVRWAATVVEQALARLREECEARGRRRVFDALRGSLLAGSREVSRSELAKNFGVSETRVRALLLTLRRRYRLLLREEIARTLRNPEDANEVDNELRYLCRVLANEPK